MREKLDFKGGRMKITIQKGILAVALILVVAWQAGAFARGTSISPQEAMTLQASGQILLVDVREKDEVAEGVLAGAIWIPLSGIQSGAPEIAARIAGWDKSKEVVVYCRSGRRSSIVAEKLASQGFRVRNLGGYSAARAAGMKSEALKAP